MGPGMDELSRKRPTIFIEGLPESEHEIARTFSRQLSALPQFVDRFRPALSLFDCCDAKIVELRAHRDQMRSENPDPEDDRYGPEFFADSKIFVEWMNIAARDGALTIGDLLELLEETRTTINKFPTVLAQIQGSGIDGVFDFFDSKFPGAKLIRNAFAHPSTLSNTPAEMRRNMHTGGSSRLVAVPSGEASYMISGISGRVVTVTKNGQILEFEMSQETFDTLAAILLKFYQALGPAETETRRLWDEWRGSLIS